MKLTDVPSGRGALATWREFGRLGDIKDGVVRIDHSIGENPPTDADRAYEIMYTFVDEALVEHIIPLVPEVVTSS